MICNLLMMDRVFKSRVLELDSSDWLNASWTRLFFIFGDILKCSTSKAIKTRKNLAKNEEKPCWACIQPISGFDFWSQKPDFRDPVHHLKCIGHFLQWFFFRNWQIWHSIGYLSIVTRFKCLQCGYSWFNQRSWCQIILVKLFWRFLKQICWQSCGKSRTFLWYVIIQLICYTKGQIIYFIKGISLRFF